MYFAPTIGGSIKGSQISLKLSCVEQVEVENCNQLRIIETYYKTGKEVTYDLPVSYIDEFKSDFASFLEDVYPEEGPNYKAERDSLTIAGKVLIGWYRLPLALSTDKKYMKSVEASKKNFAKYIDIMANSDLQGSVVLENEKTSAFFFMEKIEQFISEEN